VEFTKSLENDLKRRDFTMNAIVYNDKDGFVDMFSGVDDIKAGIIRAIGEPKKRFEEDALRILRAMRFSSTLGFQIEENTKKAMLECKSLSAIS
jgi:tRNA nucleotidyltransferase (CCA-adding enzyme)